MATFVRLRVVAWLFLAGILFGGSADAVDILVGKASDGSCTESTIQAAIDRAKELRGHNVVRVTDDVPDGVWHENLVMRERGSALQLEIAGGYRSCSDLTPTGEPAEIVGDAQPWPVLTILGQANVTLHGLRMQRGGSPWFGAGGIEFNGHGHVQLTDTAVVDNLGSGIIMRGQGGEAHLDLLVGVEISGHMRGIDVIGDSQLTIRGDGNSIHHNTQNGVFLVGLAVADIGATGRVLADNGGFGLVIGAGESSSGRTTRLYSTDPTNPLTIAGNTSGAIWLQALELPVRQRGSPHRLCTRNIAITGNTARPIYAEGALARLEMNSDCEFPEAANITCSGLHERGHCNSIDHNIADENNALIAAVRGAVITIDRVYMAENTAKTILSTNLNTPAADSSITLTTSLVVDNTLSGSLFESLNNGRVDVRDSTIADNVGPFPSSLVGIAPGLLQISNSIIDQTQTLLELEGDPATARINQVLAPNTAGTHPGDVVVHGRPTFIPGTFQLQPDALGIDYALSEGGVDFNGDPRDIDTIGVDNVHGPRDLGAYESQALFHDTIFTDGFD